MQKNRRLASRLVRHIGNAILAMAFFIPLCIPAASQAYTLDYRHVIKTTGPLLVASAYRHQVAADAAGRTFTVATYYDAAYSNSGLVYHGFDAAGNSLGGDYSWRGPVQPGGTLGDLNAVGVAVDSGSNLVMLGQYREGGTPGWDALVWKAPSASPTANAWTRRLDVTGFDENPMAILVDASNDIYVAGEAYDAVSSGFSAFVVKLSGTNGATLWSQTRPGGFGGMALDGSGGLVFATRPVSGANPPASVIRYASNGTASWSANSGSSRDVSPSSVAISAAGDIFLSGYTSTGTMDMWLQKRSAASGAVAWERFYDGGGNDEAVRLAVDPSGNPVITGYSLNGRGDYDWRTIKYDGSTGAVAWNVFLDFTGSENPTSMAVDASGNVIVNGFARDGPGARTHLHTTGYRASNGQVLFQFDFSGGSQLDDNGTHALVTPDGAVVIAGTVQDNAVGVNQPGYLVARISSYAPLFAPVLPDVLGKRDHHHVDFDNDGHEDLAWRNTANAHGAWLMNGLAFTPSLIAAPSSTASVRLLADFDADGKTDILWRETDGTYRVHLMDGFSVKSAGTLPASATLDHEAIAAFDMNGDGKADLFAQGYDGTFRRWLMNGTTVSSSAATTAPGSGYYPALATGGPMPWHIVWVGPTGDVVLTPDSGGTGVSVLGGGTGWTPVALADLDADGTQDILLRKSDGSYGAWLMAPGLYAIRTPGLLLSGGSGWEITLVADLNADGKSDLVWRQSSTNAQGGWLMDGLTNTAYASFVPAGSTWTIVGAGDYDGNGTADLLWRGMNQSYGLWTMNGLAATGYKSVLPGFSGWSPTP